MKALIVLVMRMERETPDNQTLGFLHHLISLPPRRSSDPQEGDQSGTLLEYIVNCGAELSQTDDPIAQDAVRELLGIILATADGELGSMYSTLRRNMAFMAGAPMKKITGASHLSLRELKTDPNGLTIYLCLPAMRMRTHNRWFRLIINMALQLMEVEAARPAVRVLFMLDEFVTLGRMDSLMVAAAQIAGFGVKLWFIIQDISQLRATYEDQWPTFLGNSSIIQAFGNVDSETLDYLSKRLGQRTVTFWSERSGFISMNSRGEGGTGFEKRSESVALLSPDELCLHFSRETGLCLVLYPDKRPIYLDRIVYHTDSDLKSLADR